MEKFEGVANTTFVPLVARIYISKKWPDFFYDAKALALEKYLPDDAAKGSFEYTNIASVARYYNMDKTVGAFIEKHDPCNVIYLGAGLESAYFRLTEKHGLKHTRYYECDLPEVTETRRKVFGENQQEKLIGGDMFALEWVDEISDRGLPTLLIVSGVFQYFHEEKILKFIEGLKKAFPGGQLLFDATSTKGLSFTNWFIKRTGNASALMYFGVDDAAAFATKAGTKLLEETQFFTEVRPLLGKRANLISRFSMKDSDDGKKSILVLLEL
ncbi:MAG: class I SAM-dependent methyltransferase [Eubacteriales bacterium]|nr:class I SAM-dependent methyltransferase [Eubacteriales bacterium]